MQRRAYENERTIKYPAVKGDELVIHLDGAPELFEQFLFRTALEPDPAFVKRQQHIAGRLEINSAFAGIRIEHPNGNNLSGERIEGEALPYPLGLFFRFSPFKKVFLSAGIKGFKIHPNCLYVKYDATHKKNRL